MTLLGLNTSRSVIAARKNGTFERLGLHSFLQTPVIALLVIFAAAQSPSPPGNN